MVATQTGINAEEWTAFFRGEFHDAYGLLAAAGLSIYIIAGGPEAAWAAIFILVIVVAVLVDLWAHGFSH